ncbi:NifS-like class-V aminotransferase, probable cysteine desulfurase [Crocosphaera subtropica ATCC 51142]|uniref:cysteine desulfurase n=1 Tax=Crocosphaera subtropica (strain ATCC 51142 / BH68) TaxID=43989 RepID=B1X052_CROS5|nr:cysteine desulfurase family protein [Crocosphaera subtropica]ACB49553.1 NifS-like class-V aminotransferase, probable cysteine desulfurase [Crocosphaera subtropica ATCC 51142]
MQIYLDHSATTPPRSEVVAYVSQLLTEEWGNPSSLHQWGQRAAMVIETARVQVASLVNAREPESIIFTSGGTEADNLAILGIARQYSTPQHLIISSIEHPAISEPVACLEAQGWEVTRLAVNGQGRINPWDLKAAIQSNTVLISIIYGQSEIGTVQPIEELSNIAHDHAILFHTDAVQSAGRLSIDVQRLPIDLLSISSHKIYGIQGAGALYVRPGVDIDPLLLGGGQEGKKRSGTQSVGIIGGFGLAAELAVREMATESSRLIGLRDRLFDLMADCPYVIPTGDRLYRLPHHVSFVINDPFQTSETEKITGKMIVRQMNLAGIAISAGSACHSGKLSPSPILLAMGYSEKEAIKGIRLTLGQNTTREDIDWTAMVLKQVLNRLMPQLVIAK